MSLFHFTFILTRERFFIDFRGGKGGETLMRERSVGGCPPRGPDQEPSPQPPLQDRTALQPASHPAGRSLTGGLLQTLSRVCF